MEFLGYLGLVFNPALIIAALVVGGLSRRWWHLILGNLSSPLATWAFWTDQIADTSDLWSIMPTSYVAGLIWSAAAQSFKRQLTS